MPCAEVMWTVISKPVAEAVRPLSFTCFTVLLPNEPGGTSPARTAPRQRAKPRLEVIRAAVAACAGVSKTWTSDSTRNVPVLTLRGVGRPDLRVRGQLRQAVVLDDADRVDPAEVRGRALPARSVQRRLAAARSCGHRPVGRLGTSFGSPGAARAVAARIAAAARAETTARGRETPATNEDSRVGSGRCGPSFSVSRRPECSSGASPSARSGPDSASSSASRNGRACQASVSPAVSPACACSRTRTAGSTTRCWIPAARRSSSAVHADRRHDEGQPPELLARRPAGARRAALRAVLPGALRDSSAGGEGRLRRADAGRAHQRRSGDDLPGDT